jgi:hypothetical protein
MKQQKNQSTEFHDIVKNTLNNELQDLSALVDEENLVKNYTNKFQIKKKIRMKFAEKGAPHIKEENQLHINMHRSYNREDDGSVDKQTPTAKHGELSPKLIINRKRTSLAADIEKSKTGRSQFYAKYRHSLNKEVRESISFMKW